MMDDSFWHSSAVSQLRFNFDDDDVNPLANLAAIGQAGEDSILQRVEVDGHDNASAGHHLNLSARRFGSSPSTSPNDVAPSLLMDADIGSGSTFYVASGQRYASAMAPMSMTEAAKLDSEVASLRRALQEATRDRYSPLPPRQIVRRIVAGMPYSVADCKSKEHKLQLLDCALAAHDGNAIMAAVLAARSTLKQSLFYQELMARPEALDHYVVYLRSERDEHAELSDLLAMVDRSQEAALLNYRLALRSRLVRTRLDALRHCLANHFQNALSVDAGAGADDNRTFVEGHLRLIEMQRIIEEAERNTVKQHRNNLLNASVIDTLSHCCVHHYAAPESEPASPANVRRHHALTAQQFAWTALVARARCRSWHDVDGIVLTKNWLGNSTKFVIDPEKILAILQTNSADVSMLSKFARMIENVDERLAVATKFKCHEVAVDTLIQARDRLGILSYGKHILSHTKEHLYWRDAVQSNTIKWKN